MGRPPLDPTGSVYMVLLGDVFCSFPGVFSGSRTSLLLTFTAGFRMDLFSGFRGGVTLCFICIHGILICRGD